jgi:predicted transcriptional regulator
MAVPKELLTQLLALEQPLRSAIGHALLSLREIERIEIAQALLHDEDDGMTESERAELDAAIDRSFDDIKAGRTRPAAEVIASLRAERAQLDAVIDQSLEELKAGKGVPVKEAIASLRARQAARRAAHRVAR